jgi:hypothetical protein
MQRRCGTCRYFEEGGLAGSGWCRHPQRQGLQHVVFVRRGELACRTNWDQDLWEPREAGNRPALSVIAGSWVERADSPSPALHPEATPVSPPRSPRHLLGQCTKSAPDQRPKATARTVRVARRNRSQQSKSTQPQNRPNHRTSSNHSSMTYSRRPMPRSLRSRAFAAPVAIFGR